MCRRIASLVFGSFLLLVVVACKRAEIRGAVRDTDGKPLAGVTVTARGSSTHSSTNESGIYTLAHAPGSFTIVFDKSGYLRQERELTVSGRHALVVRDVTLPRRLTHKVAARCIRAAKGYPRSHHNWIVIGDVDIEPDELMRFGMPGIDGRRVGQYVEQKLITVKSIAPTATTESRPNARIEFTPFGRKYHTGDVSRDGKFPMAKVVACKEDIHDVRFRWETEDGSVATILYKSRYMDPTPFLPGERDQHSKLCSGRPGAHYTTYGYTGESSDHAVILEYRNGWRVAE